MYGKHAVLAAERIDVLHFRSTPMLASIVEGLEEHSLPCEFWFELCAIQSHLERRTIRQDFKLQPLEINPKSFNRTDYCESLKLVAMIISLSCHRFSTLIINRVKLLIFRILYKKMPRSHPEKHRSEAQSLCQAYNAANWSFNQCLL